MANTVTFKIKIEGTNELKSVTVDAQELGAAFSSIQAEVKDLKGEMVSLASKTQLLESATNAFSQLQNILAGFSSAYAAQESAETRLAQAMRNTLAGLRSMRYCGLPSALPAMTWISDGTDGSGWRAMANGLVNLEQASEYQLTLSESGDSADPGFVFAKTLT